MIENNDLAPCCHCSRLKIATKQQRQPGVNFQQYHSYFLIALPTLLNSIDLIGIVHKVG
jgi:hypothetical protein